MKSFTLPIITLALISPTLTELLCSNIPASIFFQPHIFLLVVIAYGFPVLVIREMSVRWNLGIFGIIVMGLAYGLYNEGICAKTLLMNENVPIPSFDGYVRFTFNWAWATLILVWHALHSILYPIVIVSYFFPKVRKEKWLRNWQKNTVMALFSLLGLLSFFTTPKVNASPIYIPIFFVAIVSIIFLARCIPQGPQIEFLPQPVTWFPALGGFVFQTMCLLGLSILGSIKAPLFVLLIYALGILVFFYQFLKKKGLLKLPALVVFVLGDYMSVGFFPIFRAIKMGINEIWITNSLLLVGLMGIIFLTIQKSKNRT